MRKRKREDGRWSLQTVDNSQRRINLKLCDRGREIEFEYTVRPSQSSEGTTLRLDHFPNAFSVACNLEPSDITLELRQPSINTDPFL